ncbi:P-loop containing nucleoside triphosphate hydrolase protein [Mrakia frigida]|uniref:P-loop containing nucleoside triphosphate hydrolase protein n=1 Tax=Mrakia frigida TaxID=29902 RepID=UPI003FCC1CD4
MDSFNEPTTPSTDLPTPGGGWPQPPPGQVTPGGSSGLGPGAAHNMVKWEQVGLVPELLRGVLKYGIGPPNKVQQRALPFLLRGSDIIAQAPPTQERIIAYVVPAINICLSNPPVVPYRGPQIVIITTTVDQATQAYKLVRDIATPLGVRSSLCVGPTTATSSTGTWIDEQRMVAPSVIIGTPAKINELFSGGQSGRGLSGDGVRFLVIDEVDQLIARNLYEFVIEVVKRFPLPRSRSGISNAGMMSPSTGPPQSPYDAGASSPFNPTSNTQFPSMSRRFPAQTSNPAGTIGSASLNNPPSTPGGSAIPSVEGAVAQVDRQTCLFSNTVPQDVLNFSNAIQVREPVRVLVRREGGGAGGGSSSSGGGGGGGGSSTDPTTPQGGPNNAGGGGGLKHLYLYLAFTSGGGGAGARAAGDGAAAGTIGSGRGAGSVGAVGTPGGGGLGGEVNQAKEWKLEALADLLDDEAVLPGIVFVGSESGMEAVTYKLASRGLDVTVLHPELNSQARLAAVNKFRAPSVTGRGKVLVVFDLHVKANEIGFVKLVINYDLPRSVEGYAQRVSPAVSGGGRPGVVVNIIQANGGDVEMLRSCECFFKFKCSEVPVNLREAF